MTVSDQIFPGVEPYEMVIDGKLSVLEVVSVRGSVVSSPDVEVVIVAVPGPVIHVGWACGSDQTVIDVYPEHGLRMPRVLEEVPALRVKLTQCNVPTFTVHLERHVQTSVPIVHVYTLISRRNVIHVLPEFLEVDPH